jgi:pyruvate/2-oxoacid:ferredoxin oxidoreductase alpha subunit
MHATTSEQRRSMVTVDGNEAVASVAHRVSEVIAIYPITNVRNMTGGLEA